MTTKRSLDAVRQDWKSRFSNRTPASARAAAPKLEIRALAADTTEVLIYDEIGYWGITAKDFAAALASVTTPNLVVRINSPGGDVFDGLAMFNALKSHPAQVTTLIDGLAASAASFIALAGSKVTMAENAFLMIHNAWGMGIGNKADMRDMAATLEKVDTQLASIYAAKSGKPIAEIAALMDGAVDGTRFTAAEAQALGLIDAVSGDDGDGRDPEPDQDEPKALSPRVNSMRMRLRLAESS